MRQSEFDKISAALDRAEFALKELRKTEVALRRKRNAAKTMEEIAALNLEATELLQQLRRISDAVHKGNPAPHLRLVPDKE
jgi:predicted  nucleic acid-binding Zn-ribbon protein